MTTLLAAFLGIIIGALYNAEVDKYLDEWIGKWPRRTIGIAAAFGIAVLMII